MKNLVLLVVSIGFTLGICEVFLRYQPFVTLNYDRVPETLDPPARISYWTHHMSPIHPDVQTADWGKDCSEGAHGVTVLFLGDSWMESMDGIPKGFADEFLRRNPDLTCLHAVNGGVSSYAPTLYLIKGDWLLRSNRVDLVVVNVDETDLMDETLRYRRTTLRDRDGQIERVVPNVVDLVTLYKRATLQHQPIYLLRLLEDIYYDQVLVPRLRLEFYGTAKPINEYPQIMAPQVSADPIGTYGAEIEYFRSTLREMLTRFVNRVGASRVVVVHHPHYLHLKSAPADKRYNTIVSSVLKEETDGFGVQFYDALADLDALPPEEAAKLFKWPEDPFSHLTTEGYLRYGRLMADHLTGQNGPLTNTH